MEEKKTILSKLNIKDYRNDLELVLEKKNFDEEAKSLILSIFYKLDNFYKDYMVVKREVDNKNKFLENYINIIKLKCNKISILQPRKNISKSKYKINKKKGKIQCFPSENILLYAIYQLNEEQYKKGKYKLSNFTDLCVNSILNKGNSINSTEPIRDFNGWSWSVEIENSDNIMYNLIFQNLLILFGYDFIAKNMNKPNIVEIMKNKVQAENLGKLGHEFLNVFMELSVIIFNNYSQRCHQNCVMAKESINKKINLLNNRETYITSKTVSNTELIKKIQKIDIMLNDVSLTRKCYEKSLISEKNNYSSITDFMDAAEKTRDKLLAKINSNNKLLSPKEYLKNYEKYKNLLNFYEAINEDNEKVRIQSRLINLQKKFLECLKLKIAKASSKRELYNIATELRYYAHVLYKKNKTVLDQDNILTKFEEVTKLLIKRLIENKVTDTGFKSEELNYEILKYMFKTKMIKLDNLVIKISFIEDDQIEVEYYDVKMLDNKQVFNLPYDEKIVNKKDRKIKVFKIGG